MSGDSQPGDTMRGRVDESRVKLWLLMEASRWRVAGLLSAGLVVAFVAVGTLAPLDLRASMAAGDPIETLGQALVTAIVTGVTLAVTITQVVLSQELGAVGDQRDRMEGATAFRSDVASVVDAPVGPAEPAAFLRALVEVTADRAAALGEAVADAEAGSVRERVADYTDSIEGNAAAVSDRLDGAQFGTFDVVSAALDFNYSWKIYEGRRLRAVHGDELPADAAASLDDLIEVLEFFGPAREHFKTLYFQWELTNLSRAMLYAAAPALVVSGSMVLFFDDPSILPGATLGADNLLWAVAVGTALALSPFVLLGAYVLRIVTVAKRTLAIGPFVLRETQRTDDVDWE